MKKFTMIALIAILSDAIKEACEAFDDMLEENAHIIDAEAARKATFAQNLREAGIVDADIIEAARMASEEAYTEADVKDFSEQVCIEWGAEVGARAILAALPVDMVDHFEVCLDGHWQKAGTYADTVGVLIDDGYAVIGLPNRPLEYFAYSFRIDAEKKFTGLKEWGFAPYWASEGNEARLERLSEIYEDSRC